MYSMKISLKKIKSIVIGRIGDRLIVSLVFDEIVRVEAFGC